jgi:hypothetical protein
VTPIFSQENNGDDPAVILPPADLSSCSVWPAESCNWTVLNSPDHCVVERADLLAVNEQRRIGKP